MNNFLVNEEAKIQNYSDKKGVQLRKFENNKEEAQKGTDQNYPFSNTPLSMTNKNTDQSKIRPMLEAGKIKPAVGA